jgi:O-antigen/teichoic acid export membrane protein
LTQHISKIKQALRFGDPSGRIGTLYLRMRHSKFGRHVAILTGGTVLGRAITALASPLLSRLYTPADFGLLSVFFSVTTALVMICAFNYEAAIPLPKSDEVSLGVMFLSFGLLLLNSLICSAIVAVSGPSISRLLGAPQLQKYIWFLPFGLLTGGTFFILNSWAIRVQAFHSLAKRRIVQSVFQVITQLGTPFLLRGPIGLLLGDCFGRAGGSLPLFMDTQRDLQARNLHLSKRKAIEAARRYKRFPLFGMPSVLLHTGLAVLPAILLARLFGLQDAGWFGLVYQLLGVAVGLVGLGVAQVFLSNAAQLAHSSPVALRSLFLRTSRAAFLLGALPFGILVLAGPRLFGIIFGAKWTESGVYGQLLALPFLVMLAVGPVYPTLTVLEKQNWQLIADGLGVFIMSLGMWYAHHIGLSARWAVGVYGCAVLVTYVALFILAFYAISHLHRTHQVSQTIPLT